MEKKTLLPTDTTTEANHDVGGIIQGDEGEDSLIANDNIATADETHEESGQYENIESLNEMKRKKRKIKILKLKERIKKKKHNTKAHKHKVLEDKLNDTEEPEFYDRTLLNNKEGTIDVEDSLKSQLSQSDLFKGASRCFDDFKTSIQTNENAYDNYIQDTNSNVNTGKHLERSSQVWTKVIEHDPREAAETASNVGKFEKDMVKCENDPSLYNTTSSGNKAAKILSLCKKGDWTVLEQILRNVRRDSQLAQIQDQETGLTPLMIAVKENKLVVAERLLELGANVNERDKEGKTAIHYAAAYSKDDLVKLLLSKKADTSIIAGAKHELPIHLACARTSGALPVVQLLLQVKSPGKDIRLIPDKNGCIPIFHGAEVGNTAVCRELLTDLPKQQITTQRKDNGDSVLHVACRRKDLDTAKMLIDHGALVDLQNVDGHSALHLSALEGDEALVKYLITMKANAYVTDKYERSPVHLAAERGHTHIVDLLLNKFKAGLSARTKDGDTLMHIASTFGHPDTAMAFLKKGVPMYMPNKSGAICLHAASMKGHASVVKALLLKGAPVDSRTKDGYTALHLAVEFGKPQVVQTLIGYGAQVESRGGKFKEAPLHIAARTFEGEKCAEVLTKSGADVNAAMENGETALHISARCGQLQMISQLLSEGADSTRQSKAGDYPLHIAVRHCHLYVVKELLEYIANQWSKVDAYMLVNGANTEGETSVHYAAELQKNQAHDAFEAVDIMKLLLEYNGDINSHTKMTYETPLHYVSRYGNDEILLEMLKNLHPDKVQSSVNRQDKSGWSPLLVASEEGHLGVVKILLQHHARVDVFDEAQGKAALHLAAENGHLQVAEALLGKKAYVNARSKSGITPLHLACQNGYTRLVKLLIDIHKANIESLSLTKRTPLHKAAQCGQLEVCEVLLNMKADVNAVDQHGQTALHLAAGNDHSDVVKLFLKHRPELVTMVNTNGMTVAHIAAAKGSAAVVKELVRFNKAIIQTARNKISDSTALHLAAEGGHKDVVEALLQAGCDPAGENRAGNTAAHLAAKNGHLPVLEALKGKVSFRATSKKTGLTALHVAAQHGQTDFVREMLTIVPATLKSDIPAGGESGVKDLPSEHSLTPLHLAAQSGHEGLVRLLLNSPGVQADATTALLGYIPLHLAAQNGYTNVVSLLLSKSTAMLHARDKRGRTSLMLASANGHLDMVTLLIGQGADINAVDKNGWTSLHFCAKAGNQKVVELLVESGASTKFVTKDGKLPISYAASFNHTDVLSYLMHKEHATQSLMEDKKFVFDLMSCGKLNNNKCIEEFILLSPAPVETAAKMSHYFCTLAEKEKERSRDLYSAGDYCETMATDLVNIAASQNNPAQLLTAVDHNGKSFLDVLIENEQKQVISQPAVQRYLSEVWVGNLKWSTWKIVMLFIVFLFVPLVWLIISLPLKHKYNKIPIIKFMAYLVSHLYLMILFSLTIVYPIYPLWQSESLIPSWYEWLLLAWLSGLLVSELTNHSDRSGLRWINVAIIAISTTGVFCHVLGFAFQDNDRLLMLFIRNQFFACALLLCFVQLLDFLSFHHLFGPWAIIIRDLLKDLVRFLVILLIFMSGFTLHLASIYQPIYKPVTSNTSLGQGDGSGKETNLLTPLDTFEFLFFSLFGLVDPDSLPSLNRSPLWVITLVKIVFGTYMMVTLIVLINLLIAMMSDTYQRIQQASDTEWKFGRATLIRNMNKTSATPSPLNLFAKMFTYIRVVSKHRGKACSENAGRYITEEEEMDTVSDTRSMDILANSSSVWIRNVIQRQTQVAPDGGYIRQAVRHGPQPLEHVLNWQLVVRRYYQITGRSDHQLEEEDQKHCGITGQKNGRVYNMSEIVKSAFQTKIQ